MALKVKIRAWSPHGSHGEDSSVDPSLDHQEKGSTKTWLQRYRKFPSMEALIEDSSLTLKRMRQ